MTLPVLPHFVKGPLQGGDLQVGIVAGSYGLAAILTRPIAGRIVDTKGRKWLMIAGALIVGLSTMGYLFVDDVPTVLSLRLLNGLGEAFFFTGATAAVMDLAPPARRGEAVSLFSVALYVGLALGPLLGEVVFDRYDFGRVWIVAGVVGIVAAGTLLALKETKPHGMKAAPFRLVHRKGIAPGIVILASVAGFSGFATFIPLYTDQLEMGGSGGLFATYAVIITAVRAFGAQLPDRLGHKRTATISLGLSAVGLAMIAILDSAVGLYVSVPLFALGQSLAFPALMSLVVSRVGPSERGAVIATFTSFLDIAFGLGPVAFGAVAEQVGYQGGFLTGSVIALLGMFIIVKVRAESPEGAMP